MQIVMGEDLHIKCRCYMVSADKGLEWRKAGESNFSSGSNDPRNLIIRGIQRYHAGNYSCIYLGKIKAILTINVLCKFPFSN